MAKDRGDVLSYELDIGFNLSVDKAIAGLGIVSDKFTYIQSQSVSLAKSLITSFNFTDLTKVIDKTNVSLTNVADSVKLDVDLKKNYKLLEEQYELGEKINEQTEIGNKFRLGGMDKVGSKLTTMLSSGITSGAGAVYKAVYKLADGIMDYFPRSPVVVGPLMLLLNGGMKLMGMLAQGISAGAGAVYGVVMKVVGWIASALWGIVKWLAGTIFGMLREAYQMMIAVCEKYHLTNYRLYGSMADLAAQTMHTAATQGFLIDNIQQAATALMEQRVEFTGLVGMIDQADASFWKLTATMALVNRTTGVTYAIQANLNRQMMVSGYNADQMTKKWEQYINIMRNAKLTTAELSEALSIPPDQEWTIMARFGKNAIKDLADLRVGLTGVAAAANLPAGAMNTMMTTLTNALYDPKLMATFGTNSMSTMDDMFNGMITASQKMRGIVGDTITFGEHSVIKELFNLDPGQAQQFIEVHKQLEKMNEARRLRGEAEITTIKEMNQELSRTYKPMSELYDESRGLQYNIQVLGDAFAGTFGKAMMPLLKLAIQLFDRLGDKMTFKDPAKGGTSFMDRLSSSMERITTRLMPIFDRVFDAAFKFIEKLLGLIDDGLSTINGGAFDAFLSGIVGSADTVFAEVESTFRWIMSLFPNSDAKRGPFSGLTKSGKTVLTTFWSGIETTVSWFGDKLLHAFVPSGLVGFVKQALNGPFSLINMFLGGMLSNIGGGGGGVSLLASIFKPDSNILTNVKGVVGSVLEILNGTVGKFYNIGMGWMDTLLDGLGFGNIKSQFKGMVGDVFSIISPLGSAVSTGSLANNLGGVLSGVMTNGVTDIVSSLMSGITPTVPDKEDVQQIISVKTQQKSETSSRKETTLQDVVESLLGIKKVIGDKNDTVDRNDRNVSMEFDFSAITRW